MDTQGQIISRARDKARLSRAELATRVGVDHSSIARLELGYYRGAIDTLRRIAAVLDLSLAALADAPVTAPARSPSPCSGDSGSEPSNQPAP